MKMNEQPELDRLLQLARSERHAEEPHSAPFGFTTKAIATAWSSSDNNGLAWLVGIRWGAACALAVMLICVGLNRSVIGSPPVSTESVFHQQLTQLVIP